MAANLHSTEYPYLSPQGEALDVYQLLANIQPSLKAYIISLLANTSDADDILQETNHYLVKNQDQFQLGTNFKAWAFRVAYFRVKSHIRDRGRHGTVGFSEAFLDQIASTSNNYLAQSENRMTQLHQCISNLKAKEQNLVRKHYFEKQSMVALAAIFKRPTNTLHKSISRIRQKLKACIEAKNES